MTQKKRVQNPKLNLIGLSQELDTELWDWSDDEKKIIASHSAERIAEAIYTRLVAAGCEPTDVYGIIHDKDSSEKWSEQRQRLLKMPTRPHIHVVVRFKRGKGETLENLAAIIGLASQYVEKAGRGRYAFDNMLSYLVHAKDDDKHQYDPEEVATIVGKKYRAIYEENKERWWVGRAKKQRSRASETYDGLFEKCFSGEVLREDIMTNTEYRRIYAQHQSQIDGALESFAEYRAYRAAEDLKAGVFKLSVMYIHGKSGAGKSFFAKYLMDKVKRDQPDWGVYNAASRNALDDWMGEEMILMDDLRGSAMSASDWLKLLDPENMSPASARYRNKQFVAPRVIVITSSVSYREFFREAREHESEAMEQFIRRLTLAIDVVLDADNRLYGVSRIERVGQHIVSGEILEHGADEVVVLDEIEDAAEVVAGVIAKRNSDVVLPGVD